MAERQVLARRGLASLAESLPEMWARIGRRAIQQAVYEALPTYWLVRAERLEQVGTPWADEAAANCRRHAWLLSQGLPDDLAAELDEVLDVIIGAVV